MSVTFVKDCVRLLEFVDLGLEAVEAFLVLNSPLSVLLKPILSVHKFIMACFEFMITLHHLV